jgi:PAS domain S-box-containing protein
MNGVAETLTGYPPHEAYGRPLEKVFTIVNSRTGEKLTNPVKKVLSTGRTVALSNHTKLVSGKGEEFQIADSAAPIKDDSGSTRGVVLVFRDETDRYRFQQELQEREKTFRRLFESMSQGVVYHDRTGEIIRSNEAAENILGLTADQLSGRSSLDPRWRAVHKDGSDYPGETHPAMEALKTGKPVEHKIMGVFRPDLEDYVWLSVSAVPEYREGEPEPFRVFATFEDITEQRQSQEKLQKLLEEKEMLLREVHHRIKNNFNIICSLLSLQAESSESKSAESALTEARNRIMSMQKLYEHLFRSDLYSTINIGTYLNDLIQEIAAVYGKPTTTIVSKMEDITADVKIAVPLGIIINELVVNAIKYAFPSMMKGVIEIILLQEDPSRNVLTVRDDGIGVPEKFSLEKQKGFGLNLVRYLVQQINGELFVTTENGTEFRIHF